MLDRTMWFIEQCGLSMKQESLSEFYNLRSTDWGGNHHNEDHPCPFLKLG